MYVWVVYDIVDNKIRSKIAKKCLELGLYRVQKSVFLGNITRNDRDVLKLYVEELIDPSEDSVYIFPMNKEELKDTILLGQAFDKKYVTDEVYELFV